MFTSNVWILTIALSFAFNLALVTADYDAFRATEPVTCDHLPEYLLNGTFCSIDKICYFGEKIDCPGFSHHPKMKCVCSSKTQRWSCVKETCPSPSKFEFKPASGCTPNGVADLSGNHPLCPVHFPPEENPSSGCVPALYGKVCSYGSEFCCGRCFPNFDARCTPEGLWDVVDTNACFLSTCLYEDLSGLIGKTCADITSQILNKYPGARVFCATAGYVEDIALSGKVEEKYLVTDDNSGNVWAVEFYRDTGCPELSPFVTMSSSVESRYCHDPGRVCEYLRNRSDTDPELRNSDVCVCKFGRWTCVNTHPCPETSSVAGVNGISILEGRSCRNPGQECIYYTFDHSGYPLIFMASDTQYTCTCSNLDTTWDCVTSYSCPTEMPDVAKAMERWGITPSHCLSPGQECGYFEDYEEHPNCNTEYICTCRNRAWDCSARSKQCSE